MALPTAAAAAVAALAGPPARARRAKGATDTVGPWVQPVAPLPAAPLPVPVPPRRRQRQRQWLAGWPVPGWAQVVVPAQAGPCFHQAVHTSVLLLPPAIVAVAAVVAVVEAAAAARRAAVPVVLVVGVAGGWRWPGEWMQM